MDCKAEGRILIELPPSMGTTKAGKDWEKREYVMETSERYGTKMRFSIMSFDGPIEEPPQVGDIVKVRFSVEAREYNGSWYNDVKAYQVELLNKRQ